MNQTDTNEIIPPVDVETLKTVWKLRQELPPVRVDAMIFEQACKPGADVASAHHRWTLLHMLIQMAPGEVNAFLKEKEFVKDGQPSDALFEVFATYPIPVSGSFHLKDLLSSVVKDQQRD